jgi:predicted PurR-regulated permease PerM
MTASNSTPVNGLETVASPSPGSWQQLGLRLRQITPLGLARFLLNLAALAALVWLIRSTWVVLTPFVVGGVIAYIVSPLVNRLERWMPRFLAILLALSLLAGLVILFFALLVPIVVEQVYAVYASLPGLEEMRGYVNRLNEYVTTLPEPAQATIQNVYAQATVEAQANMQTYLTRLVSLMISTTLSLANTVGFILGFLVVPSWVLMALQDHRLARRSLDRLLPNWLRSDFWAVVRIFDQAFGAFIRGQLVTAFIVAGLTFAGLELLVRLMGGGDDALRYELFLAMIAGLAQLIPSIGPFLGAIPAVLIGLSVSTQMSLFIIVIYVIVQLIVVNFVNPRVEQSVTKVHPALLLMIVVALSQFGIWWVLLAAPVTAIVHNLYRYVYGRLGDPPRPAGLLPDEPLPVVATPESTKVIPLVYRRSRVRPRSG